MRNLVDGERRHRIVRELVTMLSQRVLDLVNPVIEHFLRSCIKGWEGAHNACSTLSYDKIRVRNDEHRRANKRQAQIPL